MKKLNYAMTLALILSAIPSASALAGCKVFAFTPEALYETDVPPTLEELERTGYVSPGVFKLPEGTEFNAIPRLSRKGYTVVGNSLEADYLLELGAYVYHGPTGIDFWGTQRIIRTNTHAKLYQDNPVLFTTKRQDAEGYETDTFSGSRRYKAGQLLRQIRDFLDRMPSCRG